MKTKTLLVFGGLFAGFVLGELGLRAFTAVRGKDLTTRLPPVQQGEEIFGMGMAKLVRPSANQNIVYELRPNLRVKFRGAWVQTNSLGYRGPELSPKRPHSVRVLALGDSHLFGWGVEEKQIFLNVLKDKLSDRFPQADWQMINSGVPGYNTHIEMALLKERVSQLKPDIVLLNITGNDLTLPDFLYTPKNPWALNRSFLFDLIRQNNQSPLFEPRNKASLPRRYAHLAGIRKFFEHLNELPALAKIHGFKPIIYLTHDRFHGPGGFFQLSGSLQQWAQRNKIPFVYREQIQRPTHWLSLEDHHPNVREHALKADAIFEKLKDLVG